MASDKQKKAAAERKAAEQKKAKTTAAKDALVKPKPPSEDGIKEGQQVPLHILNLRQRKLDAESRDTAREASIAAARAVNGVLRKKTKVPGPNAGKNTQAATPPPRPTGK